MTGDPTDPGGSTGRTDHTFTVSEAFLARRRRLSIGLLALITAAPWTVLTLEPGGASRFFALAPFLVVVNVTVLAGSARLVSYMSRQIPGPEWSWAPQASPARQATPATSSGGMK